MTFAALWRGYAESILREENPCIVLTDFTMHGPGSKTSADVGLCHIIYNMLKVGQKLQITKFEPFDGKNVCRVCHSLLALAYYDNGGGYLEVYPGHIGQPKCM